MQERLFNIWSTCTKTNTKYKSSTKIINKVKKITNIPIVAIGGLILKIIKIYY